MIRAQLLEFKEILRSKSEQRKPDKQTSKLLFYLFTNTRGDFTRLRIIMFLLKRSYNTHQLATGTSIGLQGDSTSHESTGEKQHDPQNW